ncbi:hypothetical protein AVEN_269230-1 [Araneus ventricosus]|uniref:Uncharacterized protein n=1 Tax=Araneus ventricosus TaxID=182803 RepID=A0A4Y2KC95_ARAVE|nr:hypothetical protein AVEN_269230-1 [Araneus ventricosus]
MPQVRHVRSIVRDIWHSRSAGDMLRRLLQNDVRGDDLFMLDAFRLYSFLPLRLECDPIFHGKYCSYAWVLSPLLFCENNLDSLCILTVASVQACFLSAAKAAESARHARLIEHVNELENGKELINIYTITVRIVEKHGKCLKVENF